MRHGHPSEDHKAAVVVGPTSSRYIKRALKRDPDLPMGEPATELHLDCECGRRITMPAVVASRPPLLACGCGILYGPTGWIESRPAAVSA